jgi:hypothetical protein
MSVEVQPQMDTDGHRWAAFPQRVRQSAFGIRRSALVVRLLSVFALILAVTGCVAPKFPPADFSAPGWVVRDIPAIWRPSAEAEEMTGELLWAARPGDGSLFVQFSKGGLPIIVARREPGGWSIRSSLRKGAFGGRGNPPSSLPWFQLAELPPMTARPPWKARISENARWVLSNDRTGERLEGVVSVP